MIIEKYSLIVLHLYNLAQLMETELNVNTLLELLRMMASEEVSQAEGRMKQLVSIKHFFTLMFHIITNKQIEQWTRTLGASFLSQHLAETLNQQNSPIIHEALIKILSHPDIKDMDKRVFQKSIIKCLEVSTLAQSQKWLFFIQQCLKNVGLYDPAFLVIACIAVAEIPTTLIQKVITSCYEPILNNIQVSVQNANLLNEMLKMWIVIVDKLLQEKSMRKILQSMISSPSLLAMISKVYELRAAEDSILCLQNGLAELNFLKYEASELNKRMLEIQTKKPGDGLERVLAFTKHFLPKFASTLTQMAKRKHQIDNSNSEDLVTTLLSITRIYLAIRPQQFSLHDAISFQNKIIFPLLVVDDVEMDRFQQSPEDFNSLAEDCCDKQTFGVMKTQAAKLLEVLGDKVEGSLKYAINRAIESINIQFGYTPTYLVQDMEIINVQAAFLILSIFSYDLTNHPDITTAIKNILSGERAKSLPPLQMSRVFTFLAYNFFQVFKQPAEGEGWLSLAINYKLHPTTRYCAFDCFSNIIEQYFSQSLLAEICQEIQCGKIGLIWQIASNIVTLHYNLLSQQGINHIISKLYLRIQNQLKSIQLQEKKDSLDIINALRIFAYLLKQAQKETTENGDRKQFIIAAIWPILEFFPQAQSLDIEDEVVKIAIHMVNAMDTLSPEIFKYLDQFITVFKQPSSSYSDKVYFRFFNQLLNKIDFNRDQQQVVKILILLKDSMLSAITKLYDFKAKKLKPIPHYRLALCNTMLVIQNAIAICGTNLLQIGSTEYFEEISSLCLRLLPHSQDETIERTASGHIILSRALNTLFLCHMHMRIDSIYKYLELLQEQKLYHGYDTKVIVMCIAKQVFQQSDITGIVILLTAVSKFVENSEAKNEVLDNIKKNKSSIKISQQAKKIDDFDKIIAQIDSPFNNDKEVHSLLIQLFSEMKTGNRELFNTLLNALPPAILNYFDKFVDFDNVQKKKRVFRKVIGIKMNSTPVNPTESEQTEKNDEKMNEGSDEDQEYDLGFKRTRAKLKRQGKRNNKATLDRKRIHMEEENI